MKLAFEEEQAARILIAGSGSDRMIVHCCQQSIEAMLRAVVEPIES
jgi:hypothetical protein